MTPEELDRQVRAIEEAGKAVAERAINATSGALLFVHVALITTLAKKKLLTAEEIDGFVKSLEGMSAIMAITSPDTGKELADVALQLRHYLFKSDSKAN